MRGDQLARPWGIIRAIEASPPNGVTVTEIAQREETGIRTIYLDLEAIQAAGFYLCTKKKEGTNRCAFIDTSKFRIPPRLSSKAAKFSKKKRFEFPLLTMFFIQFLGHISQSEKGLCVLGALA